MFNVHPLTREPCNRDMASLERAQSLPLPAARLGPFHEPSGLGGIIGAAGGISGRRHRRFSETVASAMPPAAKVAFAAASA
jgi:hypothetical protein